MRRVTLSLVILFGLTLCLIKLLKINGELELASTPAERVDETDDVIGRYVHSPLLESRRLRAHAGIEAYLDWHYSLSGSFTGQGATLYRAVKTIRERSIDPLDRPVEATEDASRYTEISSESAASSGLPESISSYFEELEHLNKLRLHQLVFRHLTDWRADELSALSDEVRGHSRLLVGALDRAVVGRAISQLERARYTHTPFQRQLPHEVKLGAASVMALVEVSIIRGVWARMSERAAQRFIARQIALSAARSSALGAGIEGARLGAGVGATWCSALGPLSSGACAVGGFVLGFVASEWIINVIDEGYHRAELRVEISREVDRAFKRFERALNASITDLPADTSTQDARDGDHLLRLIDLFD